MIWIFIGFTVIGFIVGTWLGSGRGYTDLPALTGFLGMCIGIVVGALAVHFIR